MAADSARMEKIVALCKRRGFIYPSSEIYGGIGGFWDYGPLGVELKRNIKETWWREMVTDPPAGPDGREFEMVGVDCAIIMNREVWVASGHATGFADPMVDCKECKSRFRADHIVAGRLLQIDQLPEPGTWWYDDFIPIAQAQTNAPVVWSTLGEPELVLAVVRRTTGDDRARLHLIQSKTPHVGHASAGFFFSSRGRIFTCVLGLTDEKLAAGTPCPKCGGQLTEPRAFNLMFESHAGALQDESNKVYLRPETAQGIFANCKNVLDTTRVKLPFGIAQVGKAFRNEINPRNFTFRSREFEQMEIEFFCKGAEELQPGDVSDMDWYQFWRNTRYNWYVNLGLKSEKLRLRDQSKDELAHYSRACADIEYLFPFSDEFQELEGVAHRGCFDLTQHSRHSGKDLSYFDDEAWQRDAVKFKEDPNAAKEAKSKPPYKFLPTVIEPSAGADRATLAFLCEAYTEDTAPNDKGQPETRIVMKFHPKLAPVKAAFFPLVNKEGMPDIAHALHREARRRFNVFYDDGGAIGRRYRRQDEAGTPYCITVDGETLKDGTVTIRDRDTLAQVRVAKDRVVAWLAERVGE